MYWEYNLKVCDVDGKEEYHSGVIFADSFEEAVDIVSGFYEDSSCNVFGSISLSEIKGE